MLRQPSRKWIWMVIGWGGIGLLAAACASSNVLNVQYSLPALASGPISRRVVTVFEDARKNSAFFTPAAQNELEGVLNVYALTVSKPGRAAELKGAYPLGPFFTEILRYRLEDSGVKVVPPTVMSDAQFTFVLTKFLLDFTDRKWSATAAYEARLSKDGALLSTQTVRGTAERVKLMKKADAEKVIGELVSDTVNQMDLTTLFKQAGL